MAQELFGTPTTEPSMISKIGGVLGGFGAGVQGKGQAYLADLQTRKEDEEKKRLAAMVKDAKQTYDFLNRGDVNNAMSLIQDRVQMIGKLGGDPSDTARIGAMLESGRIAEAQNELRGFLRPFIPTAPIKASELTPTGQRVTFDPLTQTTTAEDVAGFRAEPEEDKTFEKESGLRKEFNALDTVKNFAIISGGLGKVLTSAKDPSGAGDISLLFAYMKMLDPNSVVREGEFATAQNAGSVPESLMARYNKVINGELLSDEIRNDFVDRAQRLYENEAETFGRTYDKYKNIASSNKLDPTRALIDYRYNPASPEVLNIPRSAVDQGITADVWGAMSPEEQALFN